MNVIRSPEGGEVVKKMRDLSMVGGGRDEEEGGAGEEEKKEEEEDSEEALKKAREWDDFKDGKGLIYRWKIMK